MSKIQRLLEMRRQRVVPCWMRWTCFVMVTTQRMNQTRRMHQIGCLGKEKHGLVTLIMCFVLRLTENKFFTYSQSTSANIPSSPSETAPIKALKKFIPMLSKKCIYSAGSRAFGKFG